MTNVGSSESEAVTDIVSMNRRDDGRMDVVCKGRNGAPNYTVIATDADLANGNVCTSRGGAAETDGIVVTNVSSPFADPSLSYFASRDLRALRRRGVLSNADDTLIERLALVTGIPSRNGELTLAALLAADSTGVSAGLLPAERAQLGHLWDLFTVHAGAPLESITWPKPEVTVTSTDPLPQRLEGRPALAISAFDAAAQTALARAAQYGTSPVGTITWETLHRALTSRGPFTAAELELLATALDQFTKELAPEVPTTSITFDSSGVAVRSFPVGGIEVTATATPRLDYSRSSRWGCSTQTSQQRTFVAKIPSGTSLYVNSTNSFSAYDASNRGVAGPDFLGNGGSLRIEQLTEAPGRMVFEEWLGTTNARQVMVAQDIERTFPVSTDCAHLFSVNGVTESVANASAGAVIALPPGRYPLTLRGLGGAVPAFLDVFTHRLARLSVDSTSSPLFAGGAEFYPAGVCGSDFHVSALLGDIGNPRQLMIRCIKDGRTNGTPYSGAIDPATRL